MNAKPKSVEAQPDAPDSALEEGYKAKAAAEAQTADPASAFIEVHTTCASEDEAQRIAALAVDKRLCACAHIYPVQSCYRWNNAVQRASEWRVAFKTVPDRYEELAELVRSEHSYELPALFVTPATQATAEYAAWVQENARGIGRGRGWTRDELYD